MGEGNIYLSFISVFSGKLLLSIVGILVTSEQRPDVGSYEYCRSSEFCSLSSPVPQQATDFE
jgi:hypothetical protein